MRILLRYGRLLRNSVLCPRHQTPSQIQYWNIQVKISAREAVLTKSKAFLVMITRTHVHPLKEY